jgi:putative DNA primase/helicase
MKPTKLTSEEKRVAEWNRRCVAAYAEWKESVADLNEYSAAGYADSPRAIIGCFLESAKAGNALHAEDVWPDVLASDWGENFSFSFDVGFVFISDHRGISYQTIGAGWLCDLFTVRGIGHDPRTGRETLVITSIDSTKRTRTLHIPRGLLAGNDAALASFCADNGFNISGEKKARRIVQSLMMAFRGPRLDIREETGWVPNTASFVMPSGKIIGENRRVIFASEKVGVTNTVSMRGDYDSWKELVEKTVPGNSRLELALCAGLYSPLIPFVGDPRCVIFNIHGETSQGKTTAGYVFGSVWGGDVKRDLRYAHSWHQTTNALNSLAAAYSGIGLSLDELQHCPNPDIAYLFSEGEEKGRLNADSRQKGRRTWSCIAWSTGEKRLDDIVAENIKTRDAGVQSGREARFFDIPVKGTGSIKGIVEDLNKFKTTEALVTEIADGTRNNYGHAGPAFVQSLADFLLDNGEEELKAKVASATAKVLKAFDLEATANPLVKRVARAFAQVGAAGILAAEFEVISNDPEELIDGVVKCFTDWLAGRGSQHFTHGEIKSVAALRDFIQSKKHLFLRPDTRDVDFKGQEIAGYVKKIDGKECYLLTNKSWESVQRIAKATNLASSLEQHGLLVKAPSGRKQVQVRVKNANGTDTNERFYAVSSDIFSVNDLGDVAHDEEALADDGDGDDFAVKTTKTGRTLSVILAPLN